jgi:transcriptional regulator GlxA family with amidase domain
MFFLIAAQFDEIRHSGTGKRGADVITGRMDGPGQFAFFLVPKFSMMAFASAVEPLRVANRLGGKPLYRWRILTGDGGPVQASNGMTLLADGRLDGASDIPRLVVCAGFDPRRYYDRMVRTQLRRFRHAGADLGAMDTGSFFLAWAGLLDGYRATTHWESLDSFQEQFPRIQVTSFLFEMDRNRFTCAGGTAALDMMLHIIRLEHGHPLAAAVSEQFIHAPIRSAHEAQRMPPPARQGVTHHKLGRAITLMETRLEEPLSCAEIGAAAGLSNRQLERLFRHHVKRSPARYYLELRLQRAKALLQYSDMSVSSIAAACGFNSLAHFSRSYRSWSGKPPRAER